MASLLAKESLPEAKAEKREKVLVDQVTGWLRLYDDGSVDRSWTGPPELEFLATPYHPSPAEAASRGVALSDISLPPPSDHVSLRLYTPVSAAAAGGDGGLPVLLHFQGGGFCISRPTWYMYYHFYSRLAAALPAVVVSVQTRLAPEHRLPAAIDDCYRTLLWLRSRPAALPAGADLSRVFLIGDSSGGNLVHLAAAAAAREPEGFWGPVRVAGGIPVHPGFVRSARSRSELEGAQDPFLTLEMLDKFLAMALPVGATKDHPYTCPMGDGRPVGPMPAMLVALAERDLILDRQMEYREWLRKDGEAEVKVEVHVSRGVGHSFYLNSIAVERDPTVGRATEDLIRAIKAFVDTH